MECKVEEQVWFEPKKGKSFAAIITQTYLAGNKSDKENCAVSQK